MNKLLLAALLLAYLPFTAAGQHKTGFGSLSKMETELKVCEFDPEAEAVVLVDEATTDYASDYRLLTFQHTRIKILKEEGRDRGNISITYRSEDDFENVDQIEAMIINFDESGIRKDMLVERKSIFRKKIDKYRSEITFAFPDVKVGSILEYRYTLSAKHYGGLRDWTFQSDIPVYRSSYTLKMVPNAEISYLVQYNPNYKIKVQPDKLTKSIFFEMTDLPPMTDEPFMDAKKDYIQKVLFQTSKYQGAFGMQTYMTNWNEVTKQLLSREDFGRQLRINIAECDEFIKTSVAGKPDFEKMKLIHHFILSNTAWNGTYGIVTSEGVRTLWKQKSGTAAEINLLMTGMLQNAGLEAYPMLVSERGHGKITKTTPFIDQFNNVYAAVTIDGRRYYLDGTDKFTPPHLIPYSILNTTAFIANNKKGGLVDIEEPVNRYKDLVSIDATIQEDGQIAGKVRITGNEYGRCIKLMNYKGRKEEEYINHYLLNGLSNVSIENFKSENESRDSLPFTQTFVYKTGLQNTGDYTFLGLNMFTGYESNPFIIDERFSNINFGYKKLLVFNCVINLPGNMKVDALPKSIKMKNADGTLVFMRELFKDEANKKIISRIKIDIDKSMFTIDEYAELREFYKKMIELMNEQIVLKKS